MNILLYKTILYLHILSAMMSIGPFFVLLPMMKRLREADLTKQEAYLDTFRSTTRLAKHAGHALVISGVLLVMGGYWSWKSSWIVMTVLILVSSLYFLARAFSPKIRKFHEPDQDKDKLVQSLTRSIWIYLFLLLAMLWFMVVKPEIW